MRAMFTAMTSIALADAARSDVRREESRRHRVAQATTTRPRRTITGLLAAGAMLFLLLHSTTALGAAEGKASVFAPAPSYPNSTLAIDLVGHPRAGKVVKVVVSGSNDPFEIGYPGSGDYLAYQLDAFAQNGKVLPSCPAPSVRRFRTRSISASPGSRRACPRAITDGSAPRLRSRPAGRCATSSSAPTAAWSTMTPPSRRSASSCGVAEPWRRPGPQRTPPPRVRP